ncbi:hypothetical protein C7M71_021125 [Peterkaempfera bronchialis]|uniref:Uncharacterized protein n=1 Tax=Peterkaempfera bronchialis TaxID=2126346 RepID=A0A345T0N6_9ACTN|nr:hypothetical protein C7M71_021125 [Peterkaempfera bronchialis]
MELGALIMTRAGQRREVGSGSGGPGHSPGIVIALSWGIRDAFPVERVTGVVGVGTGGGGAAAAGCPALGTEPPGAGRDG